ncbi:MAG TPA: GFA family protein [Patescibacteria group bacterium]|nr:GFA family protein [Patescibacteria group bacterium]
MKLEGSCHCGAVGFLVETELIHPLSLCYCGRCRKINGSPVSAYITAGLSTLRLVRGADRSRVYQVATNARRFCGECGSSLIYQDSRWPDLCWPLASAIDTPLPEPPRFAHIFVGSKAPWFPVCAAGPQFEEYSEESIEDFHRLWGLNRQPLPGTG